MKKEKVIRFGVSIEKELLQKFDNFVKQMKFANRSEAFRHLIQEALLKEQVKPGNYVAGAIAIVYNHHTRELVDKLIDIQHQFHENIISNMHIHLDHENCLEVIVVKGKYEGIIELANCLKGQKGISFGKLTITAVGKE